MAPRLMLKGASLATTVPPPQTPTLPIHVCSATRRLIPLTVNAEVPPTAMTAKVQLVLVVLTPTKRVAAWLVAHPPKWL